MSIKIYKPAEPLELECGQVLSNLEIAYATLGTLNADQSNIVWVCHALTASAEVDAWWPGLVGEGKLYDPAHHYIICANILGSHYGTTGPLSVNPATGERYYHDFPAITVRDMVAAHEVLRKALGIERIKTCIGGSLGGQQALEWAIQQPHLIDNLVLLATNARHSAWGIAFNESQRMAIATDPTWQERRHDAGLNGMRTARSIALLSYRHYSTYGQTQSDPDISKVDQYRASSYQQYQGEKLAKRFNAFSYWALSKAMDSHNVGRGRGGLERALAQVQAATLVIGISTDVLFPVDEQKYIAAHVPAGAYTEIASPYGHDGFLTEWEQIATVISGFEARHLLTDRQLSI
jgi:homoserine O-acetyltransferase/O-succinyltransferase